MIIAPFQHLADDVDDFALLFRVVRANDHAIGEVIGEIERRITDERTQNATRAAELEKQLADPSRPTALKKIDTAELDQLRAWTPDPTAAERAAFEEAVADFEQSVKDAQEAKGKLTTEFQTVQTMLDEARKNTIHNPALNIDLFIGFAKRRRDEYDIMLKRVHHQEVQK